MMATNKNNSIVPVNVQEDLQNNNNSSSSNNNKKKKSVGDVDLIQIPELPVYKKRGPKPKHIKEAEAAHAAAVAAQKKAAYVTI